MRKITVAALTVAVAAGSVALAMASTDMVAIGYSVDFDPGEVSLGTKKPKVKAVYTGPLVGAKGDPKLKLKVTANDDSSFSADVKKAKGAGSFDIQVTPKGGEMFVIDTLFTIPPQPASTGQMSVPAGAEMRVFGDFFGTKKGKVLFGGRKAKILEWGDTEILTRTSKKTPLGVVDVVVQTKIGEGTIVGALEVTAPPPPINGKESLTAKITGQPDFKGTKKGFAGSDSGDRVAIGATMTKNTGREQYRIQIGLQFEPTTATFPTTIDLDFFASESFLLSVVKSSGGFPPSISTETYSLNNGDGTSASVTLTGYDPSSKKLAGTFSASLRDPATGDTVTVSNGEFLVALNDNE